MHVEDSPRLAAGSFKAYRMPTVRTGRLKRHTLFMICAVALISLLAGCMEQDNLLQNADFRKWKETPDGWSIEGDATVKKAGENGVELYSKTGGGSFLYQSIKPRRGNRGRPVTLAAWIKADTPGGAVIEYSDRKGNDFKSAAHPGDGQWHLLKVIVRPPETLDTFEIRIRNYRAGIIFAKDPTVTRKFVSSDKEGAVPGYDLSDTYRTAGVIALSGLIVATMVYFRRTKATPRARLLKAFIILVILADMMLILRRPLNSEVTSNIAWVVFIILAARLAVSRLRGRTWLKWGRVARPETILIMLSVFFAVLTVYAVRAGSLSEAEKDAGRAFAAMMAGAGVIAFSMLVPKKSANMEVLMRLREKRIEENGAVCLSKKLDTAVSDGCGVPLNNNEPGRN
ncbi:MAG: hypothetical protein HZB84_03430 [Deltaproteobacteria bacterium]|nr:hypothetical protein [Deltaproteobacteria bacterium]